MLARLFLQGHPGIEQGIDLGFLQRLEVEVLQSFARGK
jgi:hypothetical protein